MSVELNPKLTDHYERLSCGHQNNLLLEYPDKTKNTKGVCPKGCINTQVIKTVVIDIVKAKLE